MLPVLGKPGLCLLVLMGSAACSSNDNAAEDSSDAGKGSLGSGGQVATAGVGGAQATPGGAGNGPAAGGGNPSGGSGPGGSGTGGGGIGGSGSGGLNAGGSGTGGAVAGGAAGLGTGGDIAIGGSLSMGGTGTGGLGVGGAGVAGSETGGVTTGGVSAAGTAGVAAGGVAGAELGGAGEMGVGGTTGPSDTVTRTDSTFTFQHFPIETNSDGVWNGPATPGTQPTSTTYDTVVLENGYLRVTLLPDYGGRILSILHKPTNRELLYQNPLGTPYLMGEDIFYYNYLVIMGGIFPSFPEPEHGKYWNQPYAFEVVSESDEAVTVRMSRQDDRDLVAGVPARYDVGRTDVLVQVEVTLRAGRAGLDLHTTLTNTRDSAIPNVEYWLVTTLAPGSTPGNTAITQNARIMADMERVHLMESSWSWFGDAEQRVQDEVFLWNNLSYFENWADQGTAFANPNYQANWWGLVNYDNDMGILRVSDNQTTQGLKLWTFGMQSLDIDINDSEVWLRPTIEMWGGITPEFWSRGTMAANEVRQWSECYFPTLGLREITAASEYGAVALSSSESGTDTTLSANFTLALPDQTVRAILSVDGRVVLEREIVVESSEATKVEVTVPTSEAAPGAILEAEFLQGDQSLLSGQIALD